MSSPSPRNQQQEQSDIRLISVNDVLPGDKTQHLGTEQDPLSGQDSAFDAYDLPEIVHVFTKGDRNDLDYLEFQETNIEHLFSEGVIEKYFKVSSLTGEGIDDLKKHIYSDYLSASI